jgi:hypothetical protein
MNWQVANYKMGEKPTRDWMVRRFGDETLSLPFCGRVNYAGMFVSNFRSERRL